VLKYRGLYAVLPHVIPGPEGVAAQCFQLLVNSNKESTMDGQFLAQDDEIVDMDDVAKNEESNIEEDPDKEPDSDIKSTDDDEVEEVGPSDDEDDDE
jgi:hypothetical protein